MRNWCLVLKVACALACSTHALAEPGRKAGTSSALNVVLIISDDHGYPDYGFMGSQIVATPHLDRLAERGVVFTHAFTTASTCRPSLRTLLTGLEPIQWNTRLAAARTRGLLRPDAAEIEAFTTLPALLRREGYASFKAGKFWEPSPELAGFDAGTPDDQREGFSTSEFGRPSIEAALDFIRQPREGPFFLWFAPMLPHRPFDAGLEFHGPYRELPLSAAQRDYYANVTRFDAKVGELLRALDEAGLRERTLVIYVADNGWDPSDVSAFAGDGPRGKRTAHELGLRTPMIFDLPGATARTISDLASIADVVPTVLDLAGVPKPRQLPGRSLEPVLRGERMRPREQLFGWFPGIRPALQSEQSPPPQSEQGDASGVDGTEGAYFLRSQQFSYFWIPDPGIERLYDVTMDPQQTLDLHGRQSKQTQAFQAEIDSWRQQMRALALRDLGRRRRSATESR